jgi:NAD(P)H-hydrate epimerase
MDKYHSIGIGPGMGVSDQTIDLMKAVFSIYNKPLVVDADGLNCLAKNKDLLQELPSQSILTPHPKEFDRLFGDHASDFDRITTAREMAAKLNCIIILKGHHTLIAGPDAVFFNNNGNAGMAKGGSGDALTGIITALLAQGYNSISAAALGVYIHGAAGDIAAYRYSQEAMTPSNLIQCIGDVFLKINSLQQRVQ